MAETKEIEGKHKDPSSRWLVFFFCCFAMVMLGIVLLFARDINSEIPANSAPAEHGSMRVPNTQIPGTLPGAQNGIAPLS